MKWCCLFLSFAGACTLVTDPSRFEGGGDAGARRDGATSDTGGTDSGGATDGGGVDAPAPVCEPDCTEPDRPYCVMVTPESSACVECRTSEDCPGEQQCSEFFLCFSCDTNENGLLSADPLCDELAGPRPRDCDDDSDGFFSAFGDCATMALGAPRDCTDSLDVIRPGLAVCGVASYLSCNGAPAGFGFDPAFELSIPGYDEVAGAVSFAFPAEMPAGPPMQTEWGLIPSSHRVRPAMDVVARQIGQWSVGYARGAPTARQYAAVSVGDINYVDTTPQLAAVNTTDFPSESAPFRDVQLIAEGRSLYAGIAGRRGTFEEFVLYERSGGSWMRRMAQQTTDGEARVPLALTSHLGVPRVYFRDRTSGPANRIRWFDASASNSITQDGRNLSAFPGLGLTAVGERTWAAETASFQLFDFSLSPTRPPEVAGGSGNGAGDPRAVPAGEGAYVTFTKLAGMDRVVTGGFVPPLCGGTCPPPSSSPLAENPQAYDIATIDSAETVVFVSDFEAEDAAGRFVLLQTFDWNTNTRLGFFPLFLDSPSGGLFETVLGLSVDTIEGGPAAEVVIAALVRPTGSGPPRIVLQTIRFCEVD
ncbi:MAG: hypothetical protein AAGE52_05165 [Myxococcota bacterium]